MEEVSPEGEDEARRGTGEGRASEGRAGMEIGVRWQSDVKAGGFRKKREREGRTRGGGGGRGGSGEKVNQVFVSSRDFVENHHTIWTC
jgi:hypothetical protein